MNNTEQFEAYVKYAKEHMGECISHDDPDYEAKLQMMAEDYANYEMNGYPEDVEALCHFNDDMTYGELPF